MKKKKKERKEKRNRETREVIKSGVSLCLLSAFPYKKERKKEKYKRKRNKKGKREGISYARRVVFLTPCIARAVNRSRTVNCDTVVSSYLFIFTSATVVLASLVFQTREDNGTLSMT